MMSGEENPFDDEEEVGGDYEYQPFPPESIRDRHAFMYNIARDPSSDVVVYVDSMYNKRQWQHGSVHMSIRHTKVDGVVVSSRDTSDGKQTLWCDVHGRLLHQPGTYGGGINPCSQFSIDVNDPEEVPQAISEYTRYPDDNPQGFFYRQRLFEKWFLWAENAWIHNRRLDLSRARYGWYKATADKNGETLLPGSIPNHRPFHYPKGPKGRLSIVRNAGLGAGYEEVYFRSTFDEHGFHNVLVLEGSADPKHLGDAYYDEEAQEWVVPWTYIDADDWEGAVGYCTDWSTYPGIEKVLRWNPSSQGPSSSMGSDIFRQDLFPITYENDAGGISKTGLLPELAFDMILELHIYKYDMFQRYESNSKYYVRRTDTGYFKTELRLRGHHLLPVAPKALSAAQGA